MPFVFAHENDYLVIAVFDNKTSRFSVISDNVKKILGYHYTEMEGKDFRDFVANAEGKVRGQGKVEQNLQQQKAVGQFDIWYKHKNGKDAVWLRWDATAVNDKGDSFCVARKMEVRPIENITPFE